MSERKDDYAVECFIRSYEKHPLNTADSAVPELLRELLELRAAGKCETCDGSGFFNHGHGDVRDCPDCQPAPQPETKCDSCGGTTGFMMNRGTIDVCDDPFHDEPFPPLQPESKLPADVGIKRWPFVETPGEFADRLTDALNVFNGYVLGAVRNVLIENPPTLVNAHQPEGVVISRDVVQDAIYACVIADGPQYEITKEALRTALSGGDSARVK